MPGDWQSDLAGRLTQRQQDHLYRRRKLLGSAQGAEVSVDGSRCLNFCSNDYLGLANHPKLIEASVEATRALGAGSGASHLVCGHNSEHHLLEEELAAFTGRDRALLFSSGYMANLGVMSALLARKDVMLQDKLNHASLLDGATMAGVRLQRFRHNDGAHLAQLLSASDSSKRKIVAVDAVYSMDGDIAPLDQLAQSCGQHGAILMADDAHGFGVLGENGAGSAEHFGLDQQQLPVLMATLGKGLGSFGAFVAGNEALIETLIQHARTYIYTTALPPGVAAASRAALGLVQSEGWRRAQIKTLVTQFQRGLAHLGLQTVASESAIQAIVIGDPEKTLAWSESLFERGLLVTAIRPPTVPAGTARLRITVTAAHSEAHIDELLDGLAAVAHQLGTPCD